MTATHAVRLGSTLVAALSLLASTAFAQPRTTSMVPLPRSGPGGGSESFSFNCLVTQGPDGTGFAQASQNFTDVFDFSCTSYDDFTVPAGKTWDVHGFHADGFYTLGIVIPDSYTFEIYPDVGGAPGCGVPTYSTTVLPGAVGLADAGGRIDYCPGGTLVTLAAGPHWIAVTVTMDLAGRGQWFWNSHAVPHANGASASFDNPGGGFAVPPCSPIADCDLAFCVYGTEMDVVDCTCRAGNVNAAPGPIADVLRVNGLVGDPVCREMTVMGGVPNTVSISTPPAGGNGHYAFWFYDGVPGPADAMMLQYKPSSGVIHNLGIGCRCLPVNNSVTPGSCPCPITFPRGRTSRGLGPATAARFCLNASPGFPRYPTSFSLTFPSGFSFTLGGLVVDFGSANTKPISISNWIIVHAL